MSELIQKHDNRATIRWKLLTGASALALMAYVSSAGAADTDRPIVWIEGGWHFEGVNGSLDPFVPPLDSLVVANGLPSITSLEKTLSYSYGGEGGISFQPENSNWLFSASIRYGRAHGHRHKESEQKITGNSYATYASVGGHRKKSGFVTPTFLDYVEHKTDSSETHEILDFQAGKDVGLGRIGDGVVSIGARYVSAKVGSGLVAYERPDVAFHDTRWNGAPIINQRYVVEFYHYSASTASRESNFQGIGPSLSWRNTTPLAGNVEDGEIALDWGANAAFLFGRQSVKGDHESTVTYHYRTKHYTGAVHYKPKLKVTVVQNSVPLTRTRRTTVPNLGGFAGISYRLSDAKLSLGYRVDYFFGMIDGGVDTRHDINRSFNGPYASISIGLGD